MEMFHHVEIAVREHFVPHRLRALTDKAHGGRYGSATTAIKQFFTDLGCSVGCIVAAKGVIGSDEDRAWLYDLIWYRGSGYLRQVLVLESEWGKDNHDFEKLLQARSDIRVWLTALDNSAEVDRHLTQCRQHIRDFEQSEAGDCYLFIIHNWELGETKVETLIV
jgi:hypothetical protein